MCSLAHGHSQGAIGGDFWWSAHFSHFFTLFSISESIPGHHTTLLASSFIFVIPGCVHREELLRSCFCLLLEWQLYLPAAHKNPVHLILCDISGRVVSSRHLSLHPDCTNLLTVDITGSCSVQKRIFLELTGVEFRLKELFGGLGHLHCHVVVLVGIQSCNHTHWGSEMPTPILVGFHCSHSRCCSGLWSENFRPCRYCWNFFTPNTIEISFSIRSCTVE